MELLWDCCESNILPQDIPGFDEHRDPIEALAEDAIESQLGGPTGLASVAGTFKEFTKKEQNTSPLESDEVEVVEDETTENEEEEDFRPF